MRTRRPIVTNSCRTTLPCCVPVAQWTDQPPSKCRARNAMAPSVAAGAIRALLVAQFEDGSRAWQGVGPTG